MASGRGGNPGQPGFTTNEAAYQIRDWGAVLLLSSTADTDYGVPVVLAKDLPAHDAVLEAAVVRSARSTSRPCGKH